MYIYIYIYIYIYNIKYNIYIYYFCLYIIGKLNMIIILRRIINVESLIIFLYKCNDIYSFYS